MQPRRPRSTPVPKPLKHRIHGGTMSQLANRVARHATAAAEFPEGPQRQKFLEEIGEILDDIRGWTPIFDVLTLKNVWALMFALARYERLGPETAKLWNGAREELALLVEAPNEALAYLHSIPVPAKAEPKANPSFKQERVQFHVQCLTGRILTLIEAMISSETQCKAFKTVIKKEAREELNRIANKFHELAQGGDSGSGTPEELAVAERELA